MFSPVSKRLSFIKMKFHEGPKNMHAIISLSKETHQETNLGKLGILDRAQI